MHGFFYWTMPRVQAQVDQMSKDSKLKKEVKNVWGKSLDSSGFDGRQYSHLVLVRVKTILVIFKPYAI